MEKMWMRLCFDPQGTLTEAKRALVLRGRFPHWHGELSHNQKEGPDGKLIIEIPYSIDGYQRFLEELEEKAGRP